MNILKAFSLAMGQLDDPAFRKVIGWGVLISVVVFALVLAGLIALVPLIPDSGIGWVDTGVDWLAGLSVPLVFLATLWLFFPAVVSTVVSLFLDEIVDAVEARHYPESSGWRRSSILESIWLALKLSIVILLVNLLALPLYLMLLFTGIGALVLYLGLNGYLMGREYFEMVAIRHARPREAGRLRKGMRDQAFLGGLAISGLFMVPVVNLIAPVLGAAAMVHLFHDARTRGAVRV